MIRYRRSLSARNSLSLFRYRYHLSNDQWLLAKKAQEALEAAAREAAAHEATAHEAAAAEVEITGERNAVDSAADRMRAAAARGEIEELSDDEGERSQPRRLYTLRQLEDAAVERAIALQRAADAAVEAMTLDELVELKDETKRAAKRATRRVLRRLVTGRRE
jgi:hypothetical protein